MGNFQACYFGARIKRDFGSDKPQFSNKYERGLYHGKTHGQRRQRCFSMKYTVQTMKPNVMRRQFFSQILGIHLRVWVSMKARRCIMKKGSFDNYILGSKSKDIDSKFGQYIRHLMKQKQKDPNFELPIISGHNTQNKYKKSRYWEYKNIPSIYMPAGVNLQVDKTEYYLKTPQEMSRYEIAELEQELREINDPEFSDGEENEMTSAELKKDPEHRKFIEQMKKLCKLRHGVIKRYFEKNKYKKTSRNEIIQAAMESEVDIQEIMKEDHVHFMDANPEIREFMEQVNKDETSKVDEVVKTKGRKQGDLPDIKRMRQISKDNEPKKGKNNNVLQAYLKKQDLNAFDSPTSITEDSDDKSLSKRGFKLSYEDLGVLAEHGIPLQDFKEYDFISSDEKAKESKTQNTLEDSFDSLFDKK